MSEPIVKTERDESLKAWEVFVSRDDGVTDIVVLHVHDDGHITVRHETQAEAVNLGANAIMDAVLRSHPRFR
jgi:hypothetical protein